MPGPFPGMDPYLEDPHHWRGVHERLIVGMSDALNASLPSGFAADVNERVYVIPPDRSVYPDVAVIERPVTPESASDRSYGGTAVLDSPVTADSPYVFSLHDEPVYEGFVEIRTTGDREELVAVIELLSPTNKEANSIGREEYRRKPREVLASTAHLIEIDLLRAGEHTIAVRRDVVASGVHAWDYLACLHRAGRRWEYEVWPFTVRDRMPRISVPLTEGWADAVLDLQPLFDRAYDAGPYRRRVSYRAEPVPPLRGEDAAWSDALLRAKALR